MTYLTGNCDIEFELPKEVQFSFLCRLWIEREKKLNGSNLVFLPPISTIKKDESSLNFIFSACHLILFLIIHDLYNYAVCIQVVLESKTSW